MPAKAARSMFYLLLISLTLMLWFVFANQWNKSGYWAKKVTQGHQQQVHFRTYGTEDYFKSKTRIVKEANHTGWFASVRALGPEDLPVAFSQRYKDILKQRRGGGYWVWKLALIEMALKEMRSGDFLIYLDAGCEVNPAGEARFREYLAMLSKSPFDILSFIMPHHLEHNYTTERAFRAFGVNASNREIRDSGQYVGGILLLQKGEHLRRWLSLVSQVLESDPWLITDKYNNEARAVDPAFIDNRHDQSVFSVSRKLLGSVVLVDETYPRNQTKIPFWASRLRVKR